MASKSKKLETRGASASTDALIVGRIVKPHGVRGEVLVELQSDVPGRFDVGRELLLERSTRPSVPVRIASSRPHRGAGLLRFEGCEDRDQAEELRQALLKVPIEEVPPAPTGAYYHHELIGCRCVDASHGELGEVVDVLEDGGGTLLEVTDGGRTLLVPFVEAFLENLDIESKQIHLKLPPGLVETCVSRS